MNAVVPPPAQAERLDLRPLPGGLGAAIDGFDFGAPLSGERFDAAYDTATERRVIRRCTVLGDAPFRRRSRS